VQAATHLAPVVVHQADRAQAQRRAAEQVLEEHRAGGAGADDQHAALLGVGDRAPWGEQSDLEAGGAGAEQGEDRPEDAHRQRQGPQAVGGQAHEHAGDDDTDAPDAAAQDDPARLLDAGVPPHLAVQPAELIDHQVDGQGDGDEPPEARPVSVRHRLVEAQGQGQQIGEGGDPEIERGKRGVTSQAFGEPSPPVRGQGLRRAWQQGFLVHVGESIFLEAWTDPPRCVFLATAV
jgi:hypothetical protein